MSDEAMYDVEQFAELGARFQGVDLQRRRSTTWGGGGLPAPWRARLLSSKDERHEYRVTAYGRTVWEAMRGLVEMVKAIDVPQHHTMECPARMDPKWREKWQEMQARCTCKEPTP